MKIYSNDKLIKRNRRIGNITSLLSILILGVGMVLSFRDKTGELLPYTFGSLIAGFLLFQVGNFYMSKWGKSPRPDEKITSALKGLDDRYSLYHYYTPISHLLVGPAGVLCLLPYQQGGTVRYDADKQRWKQSGGNFFLKAFGGEGLGRPEREMKFTLDDAKNFLKRAEIDLGTHSPEVILVFTNSSVNLQAEESEFPAITAAKLKEFIRKKAKTSTLADETQKKIESSIQV
jgi:hypothetical protein